MKAHMRCSGMAGVAATAMGLRSPEELNFMLRERRVAVTA